MMPAARLAAGCVIGLAVLTGCSGGGAKTYRVQGKVELKDGDVELLRGSHIEFKHDSDELLRPSGKIAAGGGFTVETLHQGKVLSGAPEGKYKARIILGDQSDEGVPKRQGNPIHPRFLDFETSGLSVTVPSGNLIVPLSRK
jgi:hypothetical protein